MFTIFKMDKANTPILKQYPASSATFNVGEVAALDSGKITKVTGTNKPEFIVVEKGTKTTADMVTVKPIYPDEEYITTLGATGALTVGVKYTIGTDSATVTTTSTSGVATVVEAVGSAAGSPVIVKFD